MKIAVTAQNPGWTELLMTRFGRAACFVVVDGETKEWQAVENQQNRQATQGAGIQAARTIIEQGAEVLISGNVGPKAFRVLQAGAVRMFRTDPASQKTVADAVADWEQGKLEEIQAATVEGHSI
ncbi:MAG TPA: dinitrogenase iron-molybdenum cofactor biosynthesis protein [Syntrophus sp. (in: bacteria)]|nr:dinitrogenase iron-molybdenum cofactor biosynthesis protein [Syntrophus sp. (in: bacteria)]